MAFSLQLPADDKKLLVILLVIYLATRLPFLTYLPFVQDESLYSVMSYEQIQNPTLVLPTYLGEPVSWKPAPIFRLHSFLADSNLPLELRFRLPSFLAGLLTIFPLYFLLKRASDSRNLAFFALLFFLISDVSMYSNDAILTDSIAFLLISLSLFCYSEPASGRLGRFRFPAAMMFAFAAFFVKLVVAFMIVPLAIAYIYTKERETLKDPLFLISLLGAPLAFLIHLSLLDSVGLGGELYGSDIGGKLLRPDGIQSEITMIVDAISTIITGAGVWFFLALPGFLKYWRKNLFFTIWFLFTIFPLISAAAMPWYYLPVLPAICFFAALTLTQWDGKESLDLFFVIVMVLMLVLNFAIVAIHYQGLNAVFTQQRLVGEYLVNKSDVLIVGGYAPAIISYKVLEEEAASGTHLDFGWVLATNMTCDVANRYIINYYDNSLPVVDGSFSPMFTKSSVFRKPTNITHFDYVVVVYPEKNYTFPLDASLVYNTSRINVYHVN